MYGQIQSWHELGSARRTWILAKEFSRGHNTAPTKNPTSILSMALLSVILTAAHIGIFSLGEEIVMNSPTTPLYAKTA